METMQEIETKIMSLLSIKQARDGKLTPEEQCCFDQLNEKYRDESGKLLAGSFFVNSDSKWEEVA